MDSEDCLGFIKYEGKLVAEGVMDARKQASALLGLDQALRFLSQNKFQNFVIWTLKYPLKLRKGHGLLLFQKLQLPGLKQA